MRTIAPIIVIAALFVGVFPVSAQMSSAGYEIRWDTVGGGGDDVSSSASYLLRDSIGGMAPGQGSGASYELRAGYRQGLFDQVIDFAFFAQDNSVAVGVISVVGTEISCDNVTGLSVGDMVALIQDHGASQVTAIGMITAISGLNVTVDELKDAGTAPIIDGDDDALVLLSGTNLSLGSLSESSVRTAILGWDVHAEVDGGYSVQIVSDGDLRDGVEIIDPVSDGSVTPGFEEYGARSSDTSLVGSTFDTQDSAFTTMFQPVASASGFVYADRNFLTAKGSIDSLTADGSYAQSLNLIVSGNY